MLFGQHFRGAPFLCFNSKCIFINNLMYFSNQQTQALSVLYKVAGFVDNTNPYESSIFEKKIPNKLKNGDL
jgi:hypothetical protein